MNSFNLPYYMSITWTGHVLLTCLISVEFACYHEDYSMNHSNCHSPFRHLSLALVPPVLFTKLQAYSAALRNRASRACFPRRPHRFTHVHGLPRQPSCVFNQLNARSNVSTRWDSLVHFVLALEVEYSYALGAHLERAVIHLVFDNGAQRAAKVSAISVPRQNLLAAISMLLNCCIQ